MQLCPATPQANLDDSIQDSRELPRSNKTLVRSPQGGETDEMDSLPLTLLSRRIFRALKTHSKLAHALLQRLERLAYARTATSLTARRAPALTNDKCSSYGK